MIPQLEEEALANIDPLLPLLPKTFFDPANLFLVVTESYRFSKPLTYAIALNELGSDVVHQYVGQEPSGRMFNELILDYNSKWNRNGAQIAFNELFNKDERLVSITMTYRSRIADEDLRISFN